MRLLLDTNVVIWWLADSRRLGREVRDIVARQDNEAYVSSVTAFEVAVKKSLGKLKTPDDLRERIDDNAFDILPVTFDHGEAVGELPWHHRDPFDRILLAQAWCEGLTVVTGDTRFAEYDVPVIIC